MTPTPPVVRPRPSPPPPVPPTGTTSPSRRRSSSRKRGSTTSSSPSPSEGQHPQQAKAADTIAPADATTTNALGRYLGRLPLEISRDQVLPFLDGAALAQWGAACRALQAQTAGLPWAALVQREFGWVHPRKPSFLSDPQLYGLLRRATAPLVRDGEGAAVAGVQGLSGRWRPGRLYVMGESLPLACPPPCLFPPPPSPSYHQSQPNTKNQGGSLYRPHTVDNMDAFPDTGAARVEPGGWPCPFGKQALAPLDGARSAPGVVRDWEEGIWVLGGWGDEEEALRSVEVLPVRRSRAARDEADDDDDDDEGEEEGEGPPLYAQWERDDQWQARPPLQTPRCFLAAALDDGGRVHAMGALLDC